MHDINLINHLQVFQAEREIYQLFFSSETGWIYLSS